MSQSRKHSIFEACMNTASGFLLAYVTNLVVFPWFGINMTSSAAFSITLILTVVSVIRSYFWRRLFNWIHMKGIL